MYKLIYYLKYVGIFLLIIIGISLLTSLINLTGLSSDWLKKISIIFMAISFFFVSAIASKETKEKGYLLGLKLGIIFILFLLLINLLFFSTKMNMSRLIYYMILLASSVLGGSFGKNLPIKKAAR